MAILNYTTSVPTEKTAGIIQKMLVKAKAQAVLCEYDEDGVMNSMSFRIMSKHGLINFKMPANSEGVYRAILRDPKVPRRSKTRDQAARVALRILKDWVEVQIALVDAEMADITEVFLSYAQGPDGKTMYEAIEESGFRQLTHKD